MPVPEAPVPISPKASTPTDVPATPFEWSAVPGATAYRLQIAAHPAFKTTLVDADAGPSTSMTVYDELASDAAVLHWRVAARTKAGEERWSAPVRFQVRVESGAQPSPVQGASQEDVLPLAAVPGEPTAFKESGQDGLALIAPIGGEPADALATTFEWHPVPGAATYHLQVATDPAFETLAFDAEVGRSTSLTVYDLLPPDGTELHWRVRAETRTQPVVSNVGVFRSVSDIAELAPVQSRSSFADASGTGAGTSTGGDASNRALYLALSWAVATLVLAVFILSMVMSGS